MDTACRKKPGREWRFEDKNSQSGQHREHLVNGPQSVTATSYDGNRLARVQCELSVGSMGAAAMAILGMAAARGVVQNGHGCGTHGSNGQFNSG